MQKTMFVRSGSRYRIAKGVEVMEAAAIYRAHQFERAREPMTSAAIVKSFLVEQLQHCQEEFFSILFLDARNRLIAFERSFRGTVDGSAVHPREIVRSVLDYNAAAVILAHNHPSGMAMPSHADEHLTRRIVHVLGMIDVRVLDHVIVGETCYSFSEHGKL